MPNPIIASPNDGISEENSPDVYISKCLFKQNSGISILNSDCNCLIDCSTFEQCYRSSNGGSICFSQGNLVISNSKCSFSNIPDKTFGIFVYFVGKLEESFAKLVSLSIINDGVKYDQYSSYGDIFIKSCNSLEISSNNQSYLKANSGASLYLMENSNSNISYCQFCYNFAYGSILEIISNSIMNFCTILNNYVERRQRNAVIRIGFNELKISNCNIIHKINENVYYQPTDFPSKKGSFVVSKCYIPESNQWANDDLVQNLYTYLPAYNSVEIKLDVIECFSSCISKKPIIYKKNVQNQVRCMLKLKFPFAFQNLNCNLKQ